MMKSDSDFRGMLIYFETGEGKTYLAISLAEYYRTLDSNKKIVIMSAKSLAANMHNSLIKYMVNVKNMDKLEALEEISSKYKFISSNASNMPVQLQNIRRKDSDRNIEKKMGIMVESEKKYGWLENSLIIVDEAHNIFNSITNGSKNGMAFYDMIINTKNIKILFLTGTPIINSPFEIVPCFNMLIGKIKNRPFFPEMQEDFENWFIDTKKLKIKNKSKLSNYLIGRISYYGSYYTSENLEGESSSKKDFPEEFPMKIVEVPMSIYQFNIYLDARSNEKLEKSTGRGNDATITGKNIKITGGYNKDIRSKLNIKDNINGGYGGRFSSEDRKSSSTYRVKTRQISNYVFPEILRNENIKKYEELRKMKDKILAQKIRKTLKKNMVNKLLDSDISIKGLQHYSPKMLRILTTISSEKKKGKSIGMVYSEFVTGEGLGVFEKILLTMGWTKFTVASYIKSGGRLNKDENFYKTIWNAFMDNDKYCGGSKKQEKENKKQEKENKKQEKENKKQEKENKKQEKEKYDTSVAGVYAVISGGVDPDDRNIIVEALNSNQNEHGKIISLLLISSTGAEGLDLKGIRYVLMMEPYWNMARLNQVKARAVRYKSHSHLPQNKRNVSVFMFLSVYPKDIPLKNIKELTTDKYLYVSALNNQIIIDKFLQLLKETSVDCFIHKDNANKKIQNKIHCKICRPTNKPLYYDVMSEDIDMQNNCIEVDAEDSSDGEFKDTNKYNNKSIMGNLTTKITAKELILDGNIKVYYSKDEQKNGTLISRIHIYHYKPSLEAYSEMEPDNPLYTQIMEKIMQLEK